MTSSSTCRSWLFYTPLLRAADRRQTPRSPARETPSCRTASLIDTPSCRQEYRQSGRGFAARRPPFAGNPAALHFLERVAGEVKAHPDLALSPNKQTHSDSTPPNKT